jgi:tetratricopeptide (TPR) repeat protein
MERKDDAGVQREMQRALRDGAGATRLEQLYLRAWDHMANFRSDREAAVYDTITAEYPLEAEAWSSRGMIYEREQNLEAAIRMYERARSADTSYARAVMQLGYAYSTAGNHDRAIAEMKEYIRKDPGSADPRASLADLLIRVGDYDGALEQYRASLELKPDYWYAMREIGAIYLTQGRLREAEEMYLKSQRALPSEGERQEANIIAIRASIDVARGKYAEAVESFTRAFALDSLNTTAAYGIVRALTDMGKYDEAAGVVRTIGSELARRGMSRSSAMVGYHLMRARLWHKQGEQELALEQCDSAMAFTNKLIRPAVQLQMAEIFLAQKRYDDALEACDGALAVNRNYPHALFALTRVYDAMGDRTMTGEVGGRLERFWKDADPDFKMMNELKKILRHAA